MNACIRADCRIHRVHGIGDEAGFGVSGPSAIATFAPSAAAGATPATTPIA